MQNARKWIIGSIVILALIIGLGPIFVSKVAKKVFTPPKELATAPVRIKANGKVSVVKGYTVLTTPRGLNNYILLGTKAQLAEITSQANNMIYVFGTLTRPQMRSIDALAVRAAIDVTQFDIKDFKVGTEMTDQVAAGIRKKVQEQIDLRTRVLKKLKLKDSGYEVISGKLKIGKSVLVRMAKEMPCLMVEDKYGDLYFLVGTFKYPWEEYKGLTGADVDVVIVGQITVPSPEIMVLNYQNFMTFNAKGIYNNNDDLTELEPKK
ncbi:MAG: hypothetical protein NTU66_00265 [Elusimicrobia bacterium]|nr:hypothetical protein [Elusimicrobiota bacterium]